MSMTHMSQPTQKVVEDQLQTPEQPRVWDAFGESWQQGTPTPLGDTSLPATPLRPTMESEEIEMGNTVEGEQQETHGAPIEPSEVAAVRGHHRSHAQHKSSLLLEGCH